MRLVFKGIFIGLGLILILVAVFMLVLATQADKLAKLQLERSLGHALKTTVTVESVEVAALAQTLKVQGLTVTNPPGFSAKEPAMRFERIEVRFEADTLLSDAPVIDRILIEGAKVNLLFDPKEGTNIGALLNEAKRTSLERKSQQPAGTGRAYVLKELRCEKARVDFSTSVVPTPDLGLDVSPFTLQEISKDHPVTTSQVSALFIKSLLVKAATFKGILRPVGEYLERELDEMMIEQESSTQPDRVAPSPDRL